MTSTIKQLNYIKGAETDTLFNHVYWYPLCIKPSSSGTSLSDFGSIGRINTTSSTYSFEVKKIFITYNVYHNDLGSIYQSLLLFSNQDSNYNEVLEKRCSNIFSLTGRCYIYTNSYYENLREAVEFPKESLDVVFPTHHKYCLVNFVRKELFRYSQKLAFLYPQTGDATRYQESLAKL